jgi:predicted DCC family thiol-disulfide oxidoreductase YuxK
VQKVTAKIRSSQFVVRDIKPLINYFYSRSLNRHFLMPDLENIKQPVILFDGVCNLCNKVVQFVIKRDKKNIFRFASLQSSFGQNLLKCYNLPVDNFNSFILYKKGKVYAKSTAALMVAKQLPGWSLLYPLILIPAFLRNMFYDLVAKNRYKWFGKKEECWIPTHDMKSKFVE